MGIQLKSIIITALILLCHSSVLYGDSLELTNGEIIDCEKIWEEGGQIKCQRFGNINAGYQKKDVERIIRNKSVLQQGNKSEIIHISINPDNFQPVRMKVAATNIPFTTSLSDSKPDAIVREPLYRGDVQLYGFLKLGNRQNSLFHFVFDIIDSEKMLLYFDSDGNGNLTDNGILTNKGTGRFATSIQIPWKELIANCPYSGNFFIWFFTNSSGWNRGRRFSHYSQTQLEGTVCIKGIPYKAFLADSKYNDADLSNDGVCIDADRNGKIERDEMHLRHITINGVTYVFHIKW